MFKQNPIRQLTFGALFLACGIILPQLFHLIGLGSAFLPMHIPVLLCAFYLSPPYALAVGVLTPLLSALFTGMPPAFPVLCYMLPQLAACALTGSLLITRTRFHPLLVLPIAQAAGWLMATAAVFVLNGLFDAQLAAPLIFIGHALAQGWTGLILQWVMIPPLLFATMRARFKKAAVS